MAQAVTIITPTGQAVTCADSRVAGPLPLGMLDTANPFDRITIGLECGVGSLVTASRILAAPLN